MSYMEPSTTAMHDDSTPLSNLVVSAVGCSLIVLGMVVISARLRHWSVAPILACGVLIGADAVAWFRRQVDAFDPKGVIGLYGVHFFFLAPLLQIYWDVPLLGQIPNPALWLGRLACLNLAGLLVYFAARNLATRGVPRSARRYWQLDLNKASWVVPAAIALALAAHFVVLFKVGGFSGMLEAHEVYGASTVFGGTGSLRMFSGAIPFLLIVFLTVMRGQGSVRRPTVIFVVLLFVFVFTIQFLISGLGGSRSMIVHALFIVAGVVHFFWRRITVKQILAGMVPLLLFMYLFSFYKSAGSRAFGLLTGEATTEELSYKTGRTFEGVLVGDLARADVQAYELYVLVDQPGAYDLRWGRTYTSALTHIIPRWIWPNKPVPEKIIAGTDILHGRGYFHPTRQYKRSTHVFGLAGEAMLNFSWPAIPVMFGVWGFLVGRVRRRLLAWHVGDARLMITALLCLICVKALPADLHNLVWFGLWQVLIPLVTVRLIATKVPVTQFHAAWGGSPAGTEYGIPSLRAMTRG